MDGTDKTDREVREMKAILFFIVTNKISRATTIWNHTIWKRKFRKLMSIIAKYYPLYFLVPARIFVLYFIRTIHPCLMSSLMNSLTASPDTQPVLNIKIRQERWMRLCPIFPRYWLTAPTGWYRSNLIKLSAVSLILPNTTNPTASTARITHAEIMTTEAYIRIPVSSTIHSILPPKAETSTDAILTESAGIRQN